MHTRFLLRCCTIFAAAVLAASPAFAQILPDTPISPPSAPRSGGADAAVRAAIANLLASVIDSTGRSVEALSSASLEPVASRHALVVEALATAHASPAVVDCVTKFHAAENAELEKKVRQAVAKILANLMTQREKVITATMKMAQERGAGGARQMIDDVDAAFRQMQANVELAQAKLLAGLR